MTKKRDVKRKEFVVMIGPELMELIKVQMQNIHEATYGVDNGSVWIAGEILAKKLKGET